MLQLLYPIWLFGISGIIIPLLIHLWNVKKGKTLRIGSISLLGESSRQKARSLRLLDLLLLLLRCLLIIIASLLLAEPVWISTKNTDQQKGWILIEEESFPETYTRFQKEIDSLVQAGNELHLFEPDFKAVDLDHLKEAAAIRYSTKSNHAYWSLIRMLDQQIPKGSIAYIFTSNLMNRFKGERPEIVTNVIWKTYTLADSTASWIESAWFNADSINAIIAKSSPEGTKRNMVSFDPADRNSAFRVDIHDGQTKLAFRSDLEDFEKSVVIDTSTIRITVHIGNFQKDAEYLNAAIAAITKYTRRKIELNSTQSEEIKGTENIVFWLSEKKLSENQLKKLKSGSSIFIYANGKVESINGRIVLSAHTFQKNAIILHKRIQYGALKKNNIAVWEDGFGNPVLELEMVNNIRFYKFYTRFRPEWTELVWDEDFVKILVPIIIPQSQNPGSERYDRRSVDGTIFIPKLSESKYKIMQKTNKSDLKQAFWLILMLLFLCERWLSFRKNLN